MCGINQKQKKRGKKSSKLCLEFKGLSPNEIGEGSDLIVQGFPSRRAPERQRWTFPSHTIVSDRYFFFILHTHSHTYISTQSLPSVLSLEIMHPPSFLVI